MRPRNKSLALIRPDVSGHVDLSLPDLDHVHRRRSATARPVRNSASSRNNGPLPRVLYVMHCLLMIMTAQNEIDSHLRKPAEYLAGPLETMAL